MLTFKEFLTEKEIDNNDLEGQPESDTTQVSNTVNSYEKAAKKLKSLLPVNPKQKLRILDYGAGLGMGTAKIRDVFGETATVDSFEPFPSKAKEDNKPTFTNATQVTGKYDGIICLNVLNVLQPKLRTSVTKYILSLLNPGGMAIIGVRKFTGDVNSAKYFEKSEEEDNAIWILRKAKGGEVKRVYQRGFDGRELLDFVTPLAGAMTVTPLGDITANAVIVTNGSAPTKKQSQKLQTE